MKLQWAPQELLDHWTLTPEEIHLVATASKTEYNQVGCAVLLKCFQIYGKFPQRKHDKARVSSLAYWQTYGISLR